MQKLRDLVVYQNRGEHASYNSFPSAVVTFGGRMLVAFRQARDFSAIHGTTVHIDPTSRCVLIASDDQGATWTSRPCTLADHFLYGNQDPCLKVLRDGTLFASYFLWKVLETEEAGDAPSIPIYPGWVGRPIGMRTIRSTDEGRTWDEPSVLGSIPLAVRGTPVELADGTLLIAAYNRGVPVHIFASTDLGKTWTLQSNLVHPDYSLQEPQLYLCPSGKLVAFIRAVPLHEVPRGSGEGEWSPETPHFLTGRLMTAESPDGGRSWSPLEVRNIQSSTPYHALRLQSGRVLLSYGYRKKPYGIRAHLLDAECEKWGEPVIFRADGPDHDIGYASAVQLAEGTIWIFYYWHDLDGDGHRYIAATVCREQ